MKYLAFFLCALIATGSLMAQAPDEPSYANAEELLAASIELSGGAAWDSITTIITHSSISIDTPQGVMDGSLLTTQKYPGYMHVAATIGTPEGIMEQTVVITPLERYTENNFYGRQELPDNPFMFTSSPNLLKSLLMSEEFTYSIADTIWQLKPAYFVTVTAKDDQALSLYIDTKTLRVLKRVNNTPQGQVSTVLSEFTEVPVGDMSVTIPFKQIQTAMGSDQTIETTEVEVNSEIGDDIFPSILE